MDYIFIIKLFYIYIFLFIFISIGNGETFINPLYLDSQPVITPGSRTIQVSLVLKRVGLSNITAESTSIYSFCSVTNVINMTGTFKLRSVYGSAVHIYINNQENKTLIFMTNDFEMRYQQFGFQTTDIEFTANSIIVSVDKIPLYKETRYFLTVDNGTENEVVSNVTFPLENRYYVFRLYSLYDGIKALINIQTVNSGNVFYAPTITHIPFTYSVKMLYGTAPYWSKFQIYLNGIQLDSSIYRSGTEIAFYNLSSSVTHNFTVVATCRDQSKQTTKLFTVLDPISNLTVNKRYDEINNLIYVSLSAVGGDPSTYHFYIGDEPYYIDSEFIMVTPTSPVVHRFLLTDFSGGVAGEYYEHYETFDCFPNSNLTIGSFNKSISIPNYYGPDSTNQTVIETLMFTNPTLNSKHILIIVFGAIIVTAIFLAVGFAIWKCKSYKQQHSINYKLKVLNSL